MALYWRRLSKKETIHFSSVLRHALIHEINYYDCVHLYIFLVGNRLMKLAICVNNPNFAATSVAFPDSLLIMLLADTIHSIHTNIEICKNIHIMSHFHKKTYQIEHHRWRAHCARFKSDNDQLEITLTELLLINVQSYSVSHCHSLQTTEDG